MQDRGLELEEKVVTLKGTWAGEFLGGMSEMKRLSTTCQVSRALPPSGLDANHRFWRAGRRVLPLACYVLHGMLPVSSAVRVRRS